ncbi:hypothetical protein [Actinomadura sp. J1-007]|uniref:hypothetical protein n=1 Tax=Actinomadura sp. J1-007 TaxID=2661913 RepID=UPI00136B5BA3|nr:hypothetical protein [Actinomadura sp. J1-007]
MARSGACVAYGLACARADVLDGAAGALAECAYGLAGSAADVLQERSGAAGDVLQDLRVGVDGLHDPFDDAGDVAQADFQEGPGFDALEGEVHVAEDDVGAHAEPQQVQDVGLERDAGLEVLDLQGDLLDLDHRDVEEDVRFLVAGAGEGVRPVVLSVVRWHAVPPNGPRDEVLTGRLPGPAALHAGNTQVRA